ncbi:MAG: hypothetical protein IKG36_00945, partial [Mycoplasmataceae bacterium]|nr:hypothetical protein [Mycoplasmataceae bacterium]
MGSKDKKIAEITEINKVFDLKELVKSNARFKLETLEKEINNVVNLYSEMLEYIKENSGEKIKLFNNLSKKDVDNLDKKINEIIIADTSDKYSKKSGVIVEYKLKNKIPYVKKDEKILIAPFVEIVKKEIKKDKVVITIKKDDYKELKTKELKDLKGIIEREFASYKKEIKEYFKLKEEKKKATKEMKAKEVIINSYEENVFKYLEAKLKAQEAKIEKQKMQEKKKEEEKIKQKEIEDFMVLAKENGEKLEKIRAKLNSTHKALVDNEEYYRSACKDLDIDFKSNLGRTTIKVKKLAIENTLNDLLKETDDKNILVKDLKDVKKK